MEPGARLVFTHGLEVSPRSTKIFWDVDAPATLERVDVDRSDQFRDLIPQYDLILTYGGGAPVVNVTSGPNVVPPELVATNWK